MGFSLAYFIITEPSPTTTWQNGVPNLITWSKGLQDGVSTFDIELARLSQDGLIFVAKDGGPSLSPIRPVISAYTPFPSSNIKGKRLESLRARRACSRRLFPLVHQLYAWDHVFYFFTIHYPRRQRTYQRLASVARFFRADGHRVWGPQSDDGVCDDIPPFNEWCASGVGRRLVDEADCCRERGHGIVLLGRCVDSLVVLFYLCAHSCMHHGPHRILGCGGLIDIKATLYSRTLFSNNHLPGAVRSAKCRVAISDRSDSLGVPSLLRSSPHQCSSAETQREESATAEDVARAAVYRTVTEAACNGDALHCHYHSLRYDIVEYNGRSADNKNTSSTFSLGLETPPVEITENSACPTNAPSLINCKNVSRDTKKAVCAMRLEVPSCATEIGAESLRARHGLLRRGRLQLRCELIKYKAVEDILRVVPVERPFISRGQSGRLYSGMDFGEVESQSTPETRQIFAWRRMRIPTGSSPPTWRQDWI
jgi:hypothetical protein